MNVDSRSDHLLWEKCDEKFTLRSLILIADFGILANLSSTSLLKLRFLDLKSRRIKQKGLNLLSFSSHCCQEKHLTY